MRHFPRSLVALCLAAPAAITFPAAAVQAKAAPATSAAPRPTVTSTTAPPYQGPMPGVATIAPRKMADFVAAQPFLTVLAKAIDRAGLKRELNKAGPYTLFAPDDRAFARLSKTQYDALFKSKARLRAVLRHHVARGQVDALTLVTQNPVLKGLDGKAIRVVKKRGVPGVRVDGALLIGSNLVATNGLVHLVDTVIGVGTPPVPSTTVAPASTTTRPR